MILGCLAYLGIGLARDALATLWYQAVSRDRALRSGGLGGGLTAFDIVILGLLVRAWSPALIVAYSLGTGLGTYLIIKLCRRG
jgi:hypothetical protein